MKMKQASHQVVGDLLDVEGVPQHTQTRLLFDERERQHFDSPKATIKWEASEWPVRSSS
jgi:hypothetical protein